jgi:hypothetical protein
VFATTVHTKLLGVPAALGRGLLHPSHLSRELRHIWALQCRPPSLGSEVECNAPLSHPALHKALLSKSRAQR